MMPWRCSVDHGKHVSIVGNTIDIVAAASGSRDAPVWCMIYIEATKYIKGVAARVGVTL